MDVQYVDLITMNDGGAAIVQVGKGGKNLKKQTTIHRESIVESTLGMLISFSKKNKLSYF